MGSTNAYACDRLGCDALTHREAGERYPKQWRRVALTIDDDKHAGSFHSDECALSWLNALISKTFEGGHGRTP